MLLATVDSSGFDGAARIRIVIGTELLRYIPELQPANPNCPIDAFPSFSAIENPCSTLSPGETF